MARRALKPIDDPFDSPSAPAAAKPSKPRSARKTATPKPTATQKRKTKGANNAKADEQVIFVSVRPEDKERLQRAVFELRDIRATQKDVIAALLSQVGSSEKDIRDLAGVIEQLRIGDA